jgi:hypothetical protein
VRDDPYRQVLPDFGLAIERFTENVPADGRWHLLKDGEEVGSFRSLKAAQTAWREALHRSGWKPESPSVDADEVRRREQAERWARNRAG